MKKFIEKEGYSLIKVLGSGAFGDVYLVQKNTNGAKFAIKICRNLDNTKHRHFDIPYSTLREVVAIKAL